MNAWHNGEIVPDTEVTVPLMCHSFSRGSAIFEVLEFRTTSRGRAMFRAKAHADRMVNSAALLHMSLPTDSEGLVEIMRAVVAANAVPAGAVKIFAYYAERGYRLIPPEQPVHLAAFCIEEHALDDEGGWVEQVAAGTSSIRKPSPATMPIHAKACGAYLTPYLAATEVLRAGYDDVVMLDESGFIAEGALANIFFVVGGVIRTPKLRNVLPGITRDSVIEIARQEGLTVEEADILPEEALAADEAFYSSSVAHIRSIRSIDGNAIGKVVPGPVTSKMKAAIADAYAGRGSQYDKWLTPVD